MEQAESTYTCPLCGKEHNNDELCPIVLDKRKKITYSSQSYLMGSIILECFERQANFWGILKQIIYLIERLSAPGLENGLGNALFINADFVISYFSASLECPPSKFYKKLPELSQKYSKILGQIDDFCNDIYVEADDKNNINQVSMAFEEGHGPLWDMLNGVRSGFRRPLIFIDKVFSGRTPSYHLRLDFDWVSNKWRNPIHTSESKDLKSNKRKINQNLFMCIMATFHLLKTQAFLDLIYMQKKKEP